ncbi:uncharacterized protein STEHIDRAFT_157903 [Stereum hirsutum FP-91666 SS1]|uniref:uncharacterized protein n=1 Tax=Stereum hirsutum (strain FP-91666) TaxID=721885 RepID=UPI0004449EB1|nr:uncharacterized protein STEHIDRAFT_157903 [Stereum hirsutum FP-91666 SS1]EIM85262.1 hypothetical protein STEHIDRAFT_157903 [Stereum hirsutum FP-91666 SS1]
MFMRLVGVESTPAVDSLHVESPEKTSLATIQRRPLLAPAYPSARVSVPPQTRDHLSEESSKNGENVASAVDGGIAACSSIIPKARPFDEVDDEGHGRASTSGASYQRKVPRAGFRAGDTIASYVSKLRRQHSCVVHLDETNIPGFCVIMSPGIHVRLDCRHIDLWAVALAKGENCTLHTPPSLPEFRDVLHSTITHTQTTTPSRASLSSTSRHSPDTSPSLIGNRATVHVATPTPQISNTTAAPPYHPNHHDTPPNQLPATPPRTPVRSKHAFVFVSPDITPNDNIRRLLADFADHTGIDIQSESPVLEFHGFGPQSIASWTSKTISQWTGIEESTVIELQSFCEEWIEAVQRKRGII